MEPIRVNATPTLDQIATGIRYLLMTLASGATVLGYFEAAGKFNDLLQSVGPASWLVFFLWGQISARHQSKTKAALAAQLPDVVATFK